MLQQAEVVIQSRSRCQQALKNFTSNMFCAVGEKGQDACQGDSGGTLRGEAKTSTGLQVGHREPWLHPAVRRERPRGLHQRPAAHGLDQEEGSRSWDSSDSPQRPNTLPRRAGHPSPEKGCPPWTC
ncbi:unnamed protein product [Eretmochelys imbricata]